MAEAAEVAASGLPGAGPAAGAGAGVSSLLAIFAVAPVSPGLSGAVPPPHACGASVRSSGAAAPHDERERAPTNVL